MKVKMESVLLVSQIRSEGGAVWSGAGSPEIPFRSAAGRARLGEGSSCLGLGGGPSSHLPVAWLVWFAAVSLVSSIVFGTRRAPQPLC